MLKNEETGPTPDIITVLAGIFTDQRQRFRELGRYKWYVEIDGTKVGIVLATRSPPFDTFALNKNDMDRLLNGKRAGKVDEAYVVMAKVNDLGAMTYVNSIEAGQLYPKLDEMRVRHGVLGAFWCLTDPENEVF